MGGSQSTRKITVDNDNSIQVSQEAIDRIQSQLAAKQANQPLPPQSAPTYNPPSYYEPHNKQHYENAAEEAHWKRLIEKLKLEHEKINAEMEKEYKKTLKEANALFEAVNERKVAMKTLPCQEEKAKMLQCYSSNPGKSLLCSLLVNEFNDCVCKSRVAAVSATS